MRRLFEFALTARRAVATAKLRRSPLLADQNQNARDERQNSDHDCADPNMKESSDPNQNQIDS